MATRLTDSAFLEIASGNALGSEVEVGDVGGDFIYRKKREVPWC